MVNRESKVPYPASSLFLLFIIRCGRLADIRWSVCISKSQWNLCVSFSRTDVGLCIYYLFVWSNFNFLHNSQWITLPSQSCLILYSFCANFLHSLIMCLIVSSLSAHNLHLLFYCVLFILALIWVVLMALFCAAIIIRGSVSFLRFPFLSHVHVFSCDISLVILLKRPQNYFSSHFCFLVIVVPLVFVLVVLFLVVAISLLPCYCCISASTLSLCLHSPLPPSLLDTYSLSTSYLGCNILCMVISFLVIWSTCLSSLLAHFKNGPEYLTSRTAQVFNPLTSFLL